MEVFLSQQLGTRKGDLSYRRGTGTLDQAPAVLFSEVMLLPSIRTGRRIQFWKDPPPSPQKEVGRGWRLCVGG